MDRCWILNYTRGARLRQALLAGSPWIAIGFCIILVGPGFARRSWQDRHGSLLDFELYSWGQASPGAAGRIAMDRYWILYYIRGARLRQARLAGSPWIAIGSCIILVGPGFARRGWHDRHGYFDVRD